MQQCQNPHAIPAGAEEGQHTVTADRSDAKFVAPRLWRTTPDPETALAHAVPHSVVSQVLRPETAAFLTHSDIRMVTRRDAQCCVSTLISVSQYSLAQSPDDRECGDGGGAFAFPKTLPYLTSMEIEGDALAAASLTDLANLAHLSELRLLSLSGNDLIRKCGDASNDADEDGPDLVLVDGGHLSNNSHVKSILSFVSKLTSLTRLDLSMCAVDAAGLAHVGSQLLSLDRITLWKAKGLDSDGLAALATLPRLRDLNLGHCDGIDAAGLAHLASLPALQVLNVSQCGKVGNRACTSLSNLSHLQELNISWNGQIANRGFERLSKLRNLTTLEADRNRLDASSLGHVSNLPQLRQLSITYCGVEGSGFECFSRLTKLQSLNIGHSIRVDKSALSFISKLPQLRVLDVSCCQHIDTECLLHISKLPKLETLSLMGNPGVVTKGVAHLAALSETLTSLDLCGCYHLVSPALAPLAKLRKLRDLDLAQCPELDVSDLSHLTPLSQLRLLDLTFWRRLDLDDVADALFELPHLKIKA